MSHRFAFNDFRRAGLGRPPPGHSWIRVGPDLLLVRLGSRRVTQVIRNAFI
jgi:Ni/Co efflux regulator RcnB